MVLSTSGTCIALDFDDTLYSPHNGISQRAINALCSSKRHTGIVSGSSVNSIVERLYEAGEQEFLDAFAFIAGSNGAIVREPDGRCIVQVEDSAAKMRTARALLARYASCGKVVDTGYSIGLLTRESGLKADIAEAISAAGLHATMWCGGVSVTLIGKGEAIEQYCARRGMCIAVAIGDSENDIPLFECATANGGIAAVVGNSKLQHPLIAYRASAHYGDGVAEVLGRL